MGSRYLTTDGQLMQYQFPSGPPTSTGQILAFDGSNLAWEAMSGGGTIEGSPNQISIAVDGTTTIISLNSDNVIIPSTLTVGGVELPTSPGTAGQVLAMGSTMQAVWATSTSSGTIQGTADQIQVATAGSMSTISLVDNPIILGSLGVNGGGILARAYQQQDNSEAPLYTAFGNTHDPQLITLQLGGSGNATAGVSAYFARIFNQNFLTIDWSTLVNLTGTAVITATPGVFFRYGDTTSGAVSNYIVSNDLSEDWTQTQWTGKSLLIGRIPVDIWNTSTPGTGEIIGVNNVSISLGPGTEEGAYALYIAMDNSSSGVAVVGVNSFSNLYTYRLGGNGGLSTLGEVPTVVSLQWS